MNMVDDASGDTLARVGSEETFGGRPAQFETDETTNLGYSMLAST
jgi:hypothetical protein